MPVILDDPAARRPPADMVKARRILMVALVATALSADRVVAAAPALRPASLGVADAARRLATRLVTSFRQIVPAMQIVATEGGRCPGERPLRPAAAPPAVLAHHADAAPFLFRLPPPLR